MSCGPQHINSQSNVPKAEILIGPNQVRIMLDQVEYSQSLPIYYSNDNPGA